MKNWGIEVNYCWNYGPSKLLLHFIEYLLDPLKKHAKIAVNSRMQYFERNSQKKSLLKVWIFGLPTTKWRPCKIFANLNRNQLLMAKILKFYEWAKSDLPITNSVCEKVWFTIDGPSKMLFFLSFTFFFQISNDYCQKSFNGFRGFLGSSTTS